MTPSPDNPLTPQTIASRWADGWNASDQSLLATLFTADATYTDLAVFRDVVGTEGITAFRVGSDELIADIHLEVLNTFGADGQVAIESLYSGWLRGAPRPFTVRGTTILRMRDGLIAADTDNYSLATVLQQSGLPADWSPGEPADDIDGTDDGEVTR